jgi:hypothetical protein
LAKGTKFEVAIHNAEVRQLLKEGEKHKRLTDDWADTHYVEILAHNEADARAKIEARYPASKGFVINHVLPVG